MNDANCRPYAAAETVPQPPEVEVIIETPRGSFLKRGATGHIDFSSLLPRPFNYGSVPKFLELDAICWMRWCLDLGWCLALASKSRFGER